MKSPYNNDTIDSLFSKELKEHQVAPPRGTWGKINSQLHVKRVPYPLYIAASVFIAALLAVGVLSINHSHNSIKQSAKINTIKPVDVVATTSKNIVVQTPSVTTSQNFSAPNTYSYSVVKNESASVNGKSSNDSQNNTINNSVLNTTIISVIPEAVAIIREGRQTTTSVPTLQNMPSKKMAGLLLPSQSINYDGLINTPANVNPTIPNTLENTNIKGFYAGINGSINSVWIVDHVAIHDNNFDYQFTPGFTYGVQAGYNFSNNFGLEMGVNINAREGQDYIYYINTFIPESKRVVLNYTEIPVIAKFKIPQISAFTGMPVVLNLNIGASYGYLRSAHTFVNGDKTGAEDQHPVNQLNALAGFSYDIYTKHAYSFSLGVMGEYGLNTTKNDDPQGSNSFTYNAPISRYSNGSDFSKPHNLSLGVNLAMNYNFSLFHH